MFYQQPDFWENPVSALKRAYKKTDNDILKNVVGARGGSTAATAILINQKQLVVANVGDSRAILCQNGEVKQITVDHDPLKRKEKNMVESKGGFVSKKPGLISCLVFLTCISSLLCIFFELHLNFKMVLYA